MPDYNIYIRGTGGTSTQSQAQEKTTPFDIREESGGSNDSIAPFIQKGVNTLGNVEGLGSQVSGAAISTLAKASPWVALGIATVSVANKVLTAGMESYSAYTGDYRHDVGFNNLKTQMGYVMNPVSLWRNNYKREIETRNRSMVIEEQTKIVGSAYENIAKKGV